MDRKEWIIVIETVTIMFLLIHSTIYTVMSQDLVEQVRECGNSERKNYEAIYEGKESL